jgi:hypothetical protein
MDDVRLTRDLCLFIERYGYIIDPTTGQRLVIPPWTPGV